MFAQVHDRIRQWGHARNPSYELVETGSETETGSEIEKEPESEKATCSYHQKSNSRTNLPWIISTFTLGSLVAISAWREYNASQRSSYENGFSTDFGK